MKKILFVLFIAAFAPNVLKSQVYHRLLPTDTVTWQHFNCMIGVKPAGEMNAQTPMLNDRPIVAIDTITLNAFLYKKIYELNFYNMNYNSKQLIGYMREDTANRKIYFKENTSSMDILLYDFNMVQGDSMYVTHFSQGLYTGYYRADSVVMRNTLAGPRKHFYMRKHANNSNPSQEYFVFIEGIGSNVHVLYPFAYFWTFCQFAQTANCKHFWNLGVSCKHDKNVKKYQSCTITQAFQNSCINVTDSCNYRNVCGMVKSLGKDPEFNVFPNPAREKITIVSESAAATSFEISDLTGRVVCRKQVDSLNKFKHEISIKDFEAGIYILKIYSGEKYSVQEIIVER